MLFRSPIPFFLYVEIPQAIYKTFDPSSFSLFQMEKCWVVRTQGYAHGPYLQHLSISGSQISRTSDVQAPSLGLLYHLATVDRDTLLPIQNDIQSYISYDSRAYISYSQI